MGRAGDEGLSPADLVAGVRAALAPIADSVVVCLAVSGGPDSVGMAHLVTAARPDLRATVVHVRHGLRDDSQDAEIARRHAATLGLPFVTVTVTVGDGAGPEDAARRARLTALREAALDAGAGWVLTGHTADDQAETVLLNIARGAGLAGLAGMPAVRALGAGVMLAHPLLGQRRAAVRQAAQATGLPLADDPTNIDARQRRARARHELLPALRALTGGQTDPVVALERLARHARRDSEALDALAAAELGVTGFLRWGPVVAVPAGAVDQAYEALAARMVRLLLHALDNQSPPPSAASVDSVLSLTDGQVQTLAGGAVVSRGGGMIAAAPADRSTLQERTGERRIDVPELGVAVCADPTAAAALLPPWAPAWAATSVAVAAIAMLQVRARRDGDQIRTVVGTQSVAAAMVDAGVPRVARELVPVISDQQGVLWVPGVAVRAGSEGPDRLYLASTRAQ